MVDARQKGKCSVSDVLVVAPDCCVFSWYRWKVGCGVLDGLNPGFLVVGEHHHQIRWRCVFLAPSLHLLVYVQHLHHLGVGLLIAPLQVVLNPVRPHLVGTEDLGDRSATQLGEARMARRCAIACRCIVRPERGFLCFALEGLAPSPAAPFMVQTGSSDPLCTLFGANQRSSPTWPQKAAFCY